MKHLILSLIMVTAFGLPVMAQTPDKGLTVRQPKQVTAVDTGGIVAYSDTAGTGASAVTPAADDGDDDGERDIVSSWNAVDDNPFSLIAYLTSVGVGGVIVAIFFVLLCLLVVFSPVILIAVILYLVFKRRNERYKIVEKAIETGRPLPRDMRGDMLEGKDVLFRKGIRNASIGLGIVAFALCVGSNWVGGIGLIVAFYGAGQAVIARTSGKKNDTGVHDEDVDL